MEPPISEPTDFQYYAISTLYVVLLLVSFLVGVWMRSHILAPPTQMTRAQFFIVSLPTGLLLSGFYARSAWAGFSASPGNIVFDAAISFGYLAFLGTLSRDALANIVSKIHK